MKAAPNPILGSERLVPDVEAHVWEDGRMYLVFPANSPKAK